jgi:hypothetical protein
MDNLMDLPMTDLAPKIAEPVQRYLEPIDDPAIVFDAALYFLDGHFLYRRRTPSGIKNKFVTVVDVAAAFTGQEADSGYLAAGVVRVGSNAGGKFYVYSAPEQQVEVIIPDHADPVKIPIPRTVLVAASGQYYLFAMAEKYFGADEAAYHAPFPNIYPDGRICWGQNSVPAVDPADARQIWNLFFEAPFNHDLAGKKMRSNMSDVLVPLAGLIGKKTFPARELVAFDNRRTIGSVISNLLRL